MPFFNVTPVRPSPRVDASPRVDLQALVPGATGWQVYRVAGFAPVFDPATLENVGFFPQGTQVALVSPNTRAGQGWWLVALIHSTKEMLVPAGALVRVW